MKAWLRERLSGWLLALGREEPARRGAEGELAHLRRELARVESDLETLERMLSRSTDSFHAGLAAGTTAHAASLRERRSRLAARIAELEAAG